MPFPFTLNLSSVQSPEALGGASSTTVDAYLTAVVVHKGASPRSGHYYAYIRRPSDDGQTSVNAASGHADWLKMDDNKVVEVTAEEVSNASAYLLFYALAKDTNTSGLLGRGRDSDSAVAEATSQAPPSPQLPPQPPPPQPPQRPSPAQSMTRLRAPSCALAKATSPPSTPSRRRSPVPLGRGSDSAVSDGMLAEGMLPLRRSPRLFRGQSDNAVLGATSPPSQPSPSSARLQGRLVAGLGGDAPPPSPPSVRRSPRLKGTPKAPDVPCPAAPGFSLATSTSSSDSTSSTDTDASTDTEGEEASQPPSQRERLSAVGDIGRHISLQQIESRCALGKYTTAVRLASRMQSVQLLSYHHEGLDTCATCLVASESDDSLAYRVRLRVGPGTLTGKCPCLGCSGSQLQVGQLGKHAAAALVVLSWETSHSLASSLPGRTARGVETPVEPRPDARNRRRFFVGGERTTYPRPPGSSQVTVPLEVISKIIDFESQSYVQAKKGEIPNALRDVIAKNEGVLGASCAAVFGGRKLLSRQRRSWLVRGHCEATDCPLKFDVGGSLLGCSKEGDSYTIHFNVQGTCVHYNAEARYGFGSSRGLEARKAVLESAGRRLDVLNRNKGPTTLYNSATANLHPTGNTQLTNAPTSKAVMAKIFAERNSLKTASDTVESLSKLLAQDWRSEDTYFQMFQNTGRGISILLFDKLGVELYRNHVQKDNGDVYIDATGDVVRRYMPPGGDPTEILLTSLNMPGVNSHPVRIFTFLSTTNTASDLGCALMHFRKSERESFRGSCQPLHINMDCGLNILIAVCDAFNKMKPDMYMRLLMAAVREGKSPLGWCQEQGISLLNWCHYHVKRAWAEHSKKIPAGGGMTKDERAAVFKGCLEIVRVAGSLVELEASIKNITLVLSTKSLSELTRKCPNVTVALPTPNSPTRTVVLELGRFGRMHRAEVTAACFNADRSINAGAMSPFFLPDSVDYINRFWLPYAPLWAEVFIKSRKMTTDAISENSNRFLKRNELGSQAGNLRIDEFVNRDRATHRDNMSRLIAEDRKRQATSGTRATNFEHVEQGIEPCETWKRAKQTKATKNDIEVSKLVLQAKKQIENGGPALKTSELRELLVSYAFAGDRSRLPEAQRRYYFNNDTSLSMFLTGQRRMKTETRCVAKEWAESTIRAATSTCVVTTAEGVGAISAPSISAPCARRGGGGVGTSGRRSGISSKKCSSTSSTSGSISGSISGSSSGSISGSSSGSRGTSRCSSAVLLYPRGRNTRDQVRVLLHSAVKRG